MACLLAVTTSLGIPTIVKWGVLAEGRNDEPVVPGKSR